MATQPTICRDHRSAVTAKSVAAHINSSHRHLAVRFRQSIVEEASALRHSGSLAADSDGKKCVQCRHIRRTKKDIQKHCRSEHGWVNLRGRGGGRKPGAAPAGGALQRFFEVVPLPAGEGQVQGESGSESGSMEEAIRAEFEAAARAIKEKDEAAAALIGEITTTQRPAPEKEREEASGDVDGAGGREADDKARSEAALAVVLLAVERVIWRAQKASQVEVVGSAAVNYIEQREAGGETNEKPFNAGQKGVTMVKYSIV
ncbi:hypothetical protein C8A01DRAFT_51362 [Parachaetomium inaequale]|uniref:Uncharacterized protein n=1 Tax=Parachaetomium inaequale TaxID=2588326 RepID=A0AAN6P6C1_9PEZI|nr:hypothetical protein C8A01DRAFT_51362 [Parachaetomium inaequale]